MLPPPKPGTLRYYLKTLTEQGQYNIDNRTAPDYVMAPSSVSVSSTASTSLVSGAPDIVSVQISNNDPNNAIYVNVGSESSGTKGVYVGPLQTAIIAPQFGDDPTRGVSAIGAAGTPSVTVSVSKIHQTDQKVF